MSLGRLTRGCSLGNADSCTKAGYLHGEGLVSKADPVSSFEFEKLGCDLDEPVACHNLGLKYEFGRGVKTNGPLAEQAYRRACQLGNSGGCNGLGDIYAKGMARPRDDRRAVELLNNPARWGTQPVARMSPCSAKDCAADIAANLKFSRITNAVVRVGLKKPAREPGKSNPSVENAPGVSV